MNQDIEKFLNLKAPPGRLTAEQAAWFLGFSAHEIPILVSKGLLKPLGRPAHNGQKYFLAATLEELRRDEKWFAKACDAVVEYWRYKNSRKGQGTTANERHSRQGPDAPEFADADTHHDLRHLFATRCIEAGVDIPTVSRWLGHQDGGALCMKTYGHLRDEHSQREALKVTF